MKDIFTIYDNDRPYHLVRTPLNINDANILANIDYDTTLQLLNNYTDAGYIIISNDDNNKTKHDILGKDYSFIPFWIKHDGTLRKSYIIVNYPINKNVFHNHNINELFSFGISLLHEYNQKMFIHNLGNKTIEIYKDKFIKPVHTKTIIDNIKHYVSEIYNDDKEYSIYFAQSFSTLSEAQSWRRGEKFLDFGIAKTYVKQWRQGE